MRNFYAIATFIIVAGLSIFSMSHFVYAADIFVQPDFSGVHTSRALTGAYPMVVSANGTPASFRVYFDSVTGATFSGSVWFRRVSDDVAPCVTGTFTPVVGFNDIPCTGGANAVVAGDQFYFLGTGPGVVLRADSSNSYPYLEVANGGGLSSQPIVTRFISVTPANGVTVGTSTTFGSHLFIADSDFRTGMYLHVNLTNNTLQNGIGGSALDAFNASFGGFIFPLVSGDNVISTSTVFFPLGQYNAQYRVEVPNTTFLVGSFLPDSLVISTSSQFIVVAPTGLDIAMASTSDVLINSLITGTTTQSVLRCNPIGFDFTTCVISIFVPPMSVIQSDFETFRSDFLTRVPMGYVTRFATILLASSSAMLPVFSATVPSILPGSGAHLVLDVNHVMDSVLNATSGPYLSAEASSTQTFYQITSHYWNIFVYLALILYILRRVIGSHVIPKLRWGRDNIDDMDGGGGSDND